MTQSEDIARSLVSDNIDEITERILVGLVSDHHNIQDSDIVRQVGEKFGNKIQANILSSEAVVDYLLESSADDETDLRNLMQERLDSDLDTGDIIFNIARDVATDEGIKAIAIDSISDMVSNYDNYDQSKFTAFLQSKSLDDLASASNSGDYDALYEEYIDNQD